MKLYTDPSLVPLDAGSVFYLIRTKPGNLNQAQLSDDCMYGVIAAEYLNSMVLLMQNVYVPFMEE